MRSPRRTAGRLAVTCLVLVTACTQAPANPSAPKVAEHRAQAGAADAALLARVSQGPRPLPSDVSRDVCRRPEPTTFGQPPRHRLACGLTTSVALALPAVDGVGALHEQAVAAGCTPDGAVDLRAWGRDYPTERLPTLSYRCGHRLKLEYAASRPFDLHTSPETISRNGEVVVSERRPDAAALARARSAPEPLGVWVSVVHIYWKE
ncbi:hypothetical protein [Mariniluteicoccus flavus]